MPTDDLMSLEDESLDTAGEKRRGPAGAVVALALLAALGALALSGWNWWQGRDGAPQLQSELQASLDTLRQIQDRQAQELDEIGSRLDAVATDRGEGSEALQSALADQRARTRSLQQELEAQRTYSSSLQQAIEAVQARLITVEAGLAAKVPAGRDAPAALGLASVEYLLRLAPERLTLFHDLAGADQALALADARLESMDNPMYLGLRQHIAEARTALAGTELPGTIEISSRLDAVQNRLQGLTFGGDAGTGERGDVASASEDAGQGWWQRLQASLAGLVKVRRSTAGAESRLTLEDKDLLRQGLWMQIEGARLALMRRDQPAWEDTLQRAMGLLDRWFDDSSPEYRSAYDELGSLSRINVSPRLPDISGPWAQIQLIREAQRATLLPTEQAEEGDAPDDSAAEAETSEEGSDAGETPRDDSE